MAPGYVRCHRPDLTRVTLEHHDEDPSHWLLSSSCHSPTARCPPASRTRGATGRTTGTRSPTMTAAPRYSPRLPCAGRSPASSRAPWRPAGAASRSTRSTPCAGWSTGSTARRTRSSPSCGERPSVEGRSSNSSARPTTYSGRQMSAWRHTLHRPPLTPADDPTYWRSRLAHSGPASWSGPRPNGDRRTAPAEGPGARPSASARRRQPLGNAGALATRTASARTRSSTSPHRPSRAGSGAAGSPTAAPRSKPPGDKSDTHEPHCSPLCLRGSRTRARPERTRAGRLPCVPHHTIRGQTP